MKILIDSKSLSKEIGAQHCMIMPRIRGIFYDLREDGHSPTMRETTATRLNGNRYEIIQTEMEIAAIIILRSRVATDKYRLSFLRKWPHIREYLKTDTEYRLYRLSYLARFSVGEIYSILKYPDRMKDESHLNDLRTLDIVVQKASPQARNSVMSDPPAKPMNSENYPYKQKFPLAALSRGMSVYFKKHQVKPMSVAEVRRSVDNKECAISRFHGQEVRFLVINHPGSEWAEICRIL